DTVRFRPMLDAANWVAVTLTRLASLAPVVVNDTRPVKLSPAVANVMPLPPALIVVVPVTDRIPVCVSAPPVPASVTLRLRPMVEAAICVPTLFVRLTLPLPLGANVIGPVSALAALFKVIDVLFAVVVNDDVPVTVRTPDCVIAPADETIR